MVKEEEAWQGEGWWGRGAAFNTWGSCSGVSPLNWLLNCCLHVVRWFKLIHFDVVQAHNLIQRAAIAKHSVAIQHGLCTLNPPSMSILWCENGAEPECRWYHFIWFETFIWNRNGLLLGFHLQFIGFFLKIASSYVGFKYVKFSKPLEMIQCTLLTNTLLDYS